MSARTDEALAKAAQEGEGAALEELLGRYKNAVRGVARSFFLEGGETEDLVQEGMIGLYSAVRDFRADGGMRFKNFAYLCIQRRIASAVRDAARKKHAPLNTYVPLADEEGAIAESLAEYDPEAALIGGEEREEFLALLRRKLSPLEWRVLLSYAEGRRIGEIAERERIGAKSVENAVQRAKKKVQKLLSERES